MTILAIYQLTAGLSLAFYLRSAFLDQRKIDRVELGFSLVFSIFWFVTLPCVVYTRLFKGKP